MAYTIITSTLYPVTLVNGTVEDATQVMAIFASIASQVNTQVNLYFAPKANPIFTGLVTLPGATANTPAQDDNSTNVANTGWVTGFLMGGYASVPLLPVGTATSEIASALFVQQEISAAMLTPVSPTDAVRTVRRARMAFYSSITF